LRKYEGRVLRIGGPRHVHHRITAAIDHRILESLDSTEQISELGGIFIGADVDSLLK
jgi:hypothetical protein